MKITAILAMTNDGIIGKNNSLPWDIPEDLKRFKELTTNQIVIMGRNTFFSLPEKFRPLPNRRNIVFSSEKIADVETVESFEELQKLLE